jgi:hypothetical protein
VDEALAIVCEEAQAQGWTAMLETKSVTRSIIAFSPDRSSHPEVDSVGKLHWRTVVFCSSPKPTSRIGPFQIDSWASATKRVIMPFLSEGVGRFTKRPGEQHLTESEAVEVRRRLPQLVRNFDVGAFISQLAQDDLSGLAPYQESLKAALLRRSVFRPLATSRAVLGWLVRFVGGFLRPAGPIVVLSSADSALDDAVLPALSTVFTGIVRRTYPDHRSSRWSTFLRSHAAHWPAVRLARFQRVVLFDGHPLLDTVTSAACGDRLAFFDRLLLRIAPKPDLFVIVDGGDEVVGSFGVRVLHCSLENADEVIPRAVLDAFVAKNPVSLPYSPAATSR